MLLVSWSSSWPRVPTVQCCFLPPCCINKLALLQEAVHWFAVWDANAHACMGARTCLALCTLAQTSVIHDAAQAAWPCEHVPVGTVSRSEFWPLRDRLPCVWPSGANPRGEHALALKWLSWLPQNKCTVVKCETLFVHILYIISSSIRSSISDEVKKSSATFMIDNLRWTILPIISQVYAVNQPNWNYRCST